MVTVSAVIEGRPARSALTGGTGVGAAVVLMLSLSIGSAVAASPPTLWGYGVRSCADYLSACEAADAGDAAEYQRYEDWLTGFVSGLNLALDEDLLSGAGIETAMRRARAHCEGNPEDDFFAATMDFVQLLTSVR
ncbi:MAG: hypothetical protein GVY22_00745 [Gammaproteobacteria bacterium]|jgi:hypothetical protein|nr:hypothetical protein [Gammaproteobacteria bacterium]